MAYCLSMIWVNNVGWRGAADNFWGGEVMRETKVDHFILF